MKPLPSLTVLRDEAHALRNEARAAGRQLKHQRSLNVVAEKYGFDNWDSLAAAVRRQPVPEPSPFLRNLQRGRVASLWAPQLEVACFWVPFTAMFGSPDAWLEASTMRKLASKYPAKFSFRDDMLLVQSRPDSFAGAAGFSPGHCPPLMTQFESELLTLYHANDNDWGKVRATGAAAQLLEQTAREYVSRYPGAASRHPEYFPAGSMSGHSPSA